MYQYAHHIIHQWYPTHQRLTYAFAGGRLMAVTIGIHDVPHATNSSATLILSHWYKHIGVNLLLLSSYILSVIIAYTTPVVSDTSTSCAFTDGRLMAATIGMRDVPRATLFHQY